MVHIIERLTFTTMKTTICVLVFTSICSVSRSHEDISSNLIRDPVELGNPYPVYGAHYEHVVKRKHSQHHHHHRTPVDQPSVVPDVNFSLETVDSTNTGRERQSVEGKFNPHQHQHHSTMPVKTPTEECPMCAAARQNAKSTAGLDDDTLRAIRVEMIKQQILKKLRLTEPPKMEHILRNHNAVLPPIALGISELSNNQVQQHDEAGDAANIDLDDFYGKTEQIIVLPQDVLNCSTWSHHTRSEAASCFIFNIPLEVRSSQISSAEMWVYKFADMPSEHDRVESHNLSISEWVTKPYNVRSSRHRSNPRFNTIASHSDVPDTAAWVKFNITDKARKWLITEVHEHVIKISCSTCSTDIQQFPFDTEGDQQPLIVFNIANGKRKQRNRRNIDCASGINECCRESLNISFTEIKWDWILEPKSFNAYYCKGQCHGDTALAHTETLHSGLMIDVVKNLGGVNNKTAELVPCCTATKMAPLTILFSKPLHQNSTQMVYKKETLPNMVVLSCGCK